MKKIKFSPSLLAQNVIFSGNSSAQKIIFSTLLLILYTSSYAQLAKWAIEPNYDILNVKVDNKILVTDSAGYTTLWTMDGKRLFTTQDEVQPFIDGVATTINKRRGTITGFVDTNGKFIALPNLPVTYDNPNFQSNFLISKDADGFCYYTKDGVRARLSQVVRSYPFHGGYAPYFTYDNIKKEKDPYFGYFTSNGSAFKYMVEDKKGVKEIDNKDVAFLSGISDQGKAVGVIKDKLYWFNTENRIFQPFLYGNEGDKNRHLQLAYNYEDYFQDLYEDTVTIIAKYGKKQFAMLRFNQELQPIEFIFENDTMIFSQQPPEPIKYPTYLTESGHQGKLGICYKGREVLPQQFADISLMYDNRAIVQMPDGKWGLLDIYPDLNCQMVINKGEDVAFRHQKYDTQLRLNLPSVISARDIRIAIPDITGCVIDKTSRETKDTESGNYVTYDCTLNIPNSLPDTRTEITYQPFKVSNAGIMFHDMPLTLRAWHYKYYNVDPIDEKEIVIDHGNVSFTINISAERRVGESDYPFEVKIAADSIDTEKISETRYKCIVYNLQEGDNNLDISVTEQGCPSAVFPFTINYTKAVPRKKEKDRVTIQKKKPKLEI